MFPWEMTNRINRFTKLIRLARHYIEKVIIKGEKYNIRSKEEAEIIDTVGHDYGVNLGAEKWRTTENTISVSMPQTIFSEDVDDELQMILEISEDMYFKEKDDMDDWIDEESLISYSAAVILAERMKIDEEFLYEVKNKVLFIANALGELQYEDPHKTQDGKWRYSVRWNGVPFHAPATIEDAERFEAAYFNIDCTFPIKEKWTVQNLHLHQVMSDAWSLCSYIDNHPFQLEGYETFRDRQVM